MLTGFVLGLVYFLFTLFVCLFTIYVCFKVVMRITRYNDVNLLNKGNIAASLIITSSFVAMAIMSRHALYPITALVQEFLMLSDKGMAEYLYLLLRSLGYLGLTVFLSLISISIALWLFQRLTRDIKEETQIRANNMAVGLLLGGVLISFAILMESGVSDFLNALIPMRDLFNR